MRGDLRDFQISTPMENEGFLSMPEPDLTLEEIEKQIQKSADSFRAALDRPAPCSKLKGFGK